MDKNVGSRYVTREYRTLHEGKDLHYFHLQLKQTDLAIGVDKESYTDSLLSLCEQEIRRLRADLESYIEISPEFYTSFEPVDLLPEAPPLAVAMARAAALAGVGPMAAVAGAFAQGVGEILKNYVHDIIVENGGDIYINTSRERMVAVFAGSSKFSNRIAIKIKSQESPLGICTSSGTVGPSISLGQADAVVIKGINAVLADAAATGAANRVHTAEDLLKAVDYVKTIKGVMGILAIKNDRMAVWGDMEILAL
ncbi:MAG: UPF0280 family protein [Syntrophomonas sp.]|nr:UPF0280 family protein [Syntrophomonas sp.]